MKHMVQQTHSHMTRALMCGLYCVAVAADCGADSVTLSGCVCTYGSDNKAPSTYYVYNQLIKWRENVRCIETYNKYEV